MISILCGVYKAEKTIEKLISSILHQTYQEWEAIFCVNGPEDRARDIIEWHAKKDDRIHIISFSECLGAGGARRKAFELVKGDYIAVVDNDDSLNSDYLSGFVSAIDMNNSPDIILSGFKRIENGKVKYMRSFCNAKNALYQSVAPWAKVYKVSFLRKHDIVFQNIPFGEDIIFTAEVILARPKIAYIEAFAYNWNNRQDSASHTIIRYFPKDNLRIVYKKFVKLAGQYKGEGRQVKYLCYKYYIWYFLQSGRHVGIKRMRKEYKRGIACLDKIFDQWVKDVFYYILGLKSERTIVRIVLAMALVLRMLRIDVFAFCIYAVLPVEYLWPDL